MLLLKNYLEGVLIGIIDIPNCLLFSVVSPSSYYFILQAFSLNFHSPLTFKTIHSSPQPTNGSWSRIRMGLLIQMLCSIIGTAYPRVTLSVEGIFPTSTGPEDATRENEETMQEDYPQCFSNFEET
jgi:hypothetical protein